MTLHSSPLLYAALLSLCVASCSDFADELPEAPAATEDLTGQPIQIGNIVVTPNNATTRTPTDESATFLVAGRTMTVFMFNPTGTDGAQVCHHANYVYTLTTTPGGTPDAPSVTTASWQLQPGSEPLCWQSSGDEHRFYAISPATDTPNANIMKETNAGNVQTITGFTPAICLPTAWTTDACEEWDQLRITPTATEQTPQRDVPISLNLSCPLVRVQIVSDASRITLRQVNAISPTTTGGTAGKAVMEMHKEAGLMYNAYILPGATEISYLTDRAVKVSKVNAALEAGDQVQIVDVNDSNADVAVLNVTAGNLDTMLGSVGEKKKIVITGKIEDADMKSLETFVKDKSITDLYILATGVTSIGSEAFYMCKSLASISLPQGVTSIGGMAFSDCTSLASISLPQGIASIGNGAFEYCTSLASISLPQGVTSIGSVFAYCTSLASISLPQGMTSIGEMAFIDCTSLASISLPQGVTSIEQQAFYGCTSLTSISLPQGITSIGYSTFYGCESLTSISLPQSLTSIGEEAFGNCPKLEDIVLSGCDFNVPSGFFLPATASDTFSQSSPVTLFLRDVPAAMFSANAAACQSWGGVSWKAIHYDYNGPDDELYHTDAARYSGHWTAP